jgi:hypothetical protein
MKKLVKRSRDVFGSEFALNTQDIFCKHVYPKDLTPCKQYNKGGIWGTLSAIVPTMRRRV